MNGAGFFELPLQPLLDQIGPNLQGGFPATMGFDMFPVSGTCPTQLRKASFVIPRIG